MSGSGRQSAPPFNEVDADGQLPGNGKSGHFPKILVTHVGGLLKDFNALQAGHTSQNVPIAS
jgi:hypothetical protein